jgi:nitroreductase
MATNDETLVNFDGSITELIRQRFSCRTYREQPVADSTRQHLDGFISTLLEGPFGTRPRFGLATATEADRAALRGLGTYGFIRNAPGFVIGAAIPDGKYLEDFGYLMELIILKATDLGLGTCWLGGTFTKSGFSRKITLAENEEIPAVAAMGYIADKGKTKSGLVRQVAKSNLRRPWGRMFWDGSFGLPLAQDRAGPYAIPLEMVRLGPSASNKQPWQILRTGDTWHLYLRRTEGYREGFFQRLLDLCDLQRLDMGIAMCHFEQTAHQLDLDGKWVIDEPDIQKPDHLTEYTVSWVPGK